MALTEGKVEMMHLIKDKGESEVTPQVWSLGEDLEIFLEDLADKHGVELVQADSHGSEIK